MEKIILKSNYDKQNLFTNLYETAQPKAIVQIVHGMKEHQLRYAPFAEFLNANGFTVITSDLRGHGPNATLLGYMEGKKPWEALVEDQVTITQYLKNRFPNTDIYLFAHSMGTIISRNLIQQHATDYKKIVLSGVPGYQAAASFGILMANLIGCFKSNTHVSNFLEKQTLGAFEKSVKNAKTPADWVSVSETNIQNYLNDPYCNIPFTVSAYKALYHLVKEMHKSSRYVVHEPTKPILMLVGALDPCPLGDKGLNGSIATLKKAGYTNVTFKKYENMRHEILNEENHTLVYEDILNFFLAEA